MNKEFTVQVIYLRSRRSRKDLFKDVASPLKGPLQEGKAKEVHVAEEGKISLSSGRPEEGCAEGSCP
jgi:hypothetical protein